MIKVFSDGSATWREWRMTELLREYVRESAGICLVVRPRKRWIDTVKDCLKKRGLDVRQARRMVHNRSERRSLREIAWGTTRGMNP